MLFINKITWIIQEKLKEVWIESVESKSEGAGNTQSNDNPARLDNSRVGQAAAQIPSQVADAIEAVIGERKGHDGFEHDLGSDG